jgi:hypothetical protein
MKKTESVITVVKDTSAIANKDWADITGQQPRHPDYFQHKETGTQYSWLAAGIAWPVLAAQEGCVVVIGCSRDDKRVFTVVDAAFAQSPRALIKLCAALRDKWCGGGSVLFSSFAGPDELYRQMLAETNNELEKAKQRRIIIRNPPDFGDKEAELLNTVFELSADNRLKVDVLPVMDALKRMTPPDAGKKLSDSPAVAAVVYVLNEMMTIKPWFSSGNDEPFILV